MAGVTSAATKSTTQAQPVVDGAAQRFLAQLKAKREASANDSNSFYVKPSGHEVITQLNMTKEERAAAAKVRQELHQRAAEELAKPVDVTGMVKNVDMTAGSVAALQKVYDQYRPGAIRYRIEDQARLFEERQADPKRRIPDDQVAQLQEAFARRRETVKIILHFDKTYPLEEQRVFFHYSQSLSEKSLSMFSAATDQRLEPVTSARVRQMLVPPTELWTPPLILLLSGPDLPEDTPVEVSTDGKVKLPLVDSAAGPQKVERTGLLSAVHIARYLMLVLECLKSNSERQYQLETDKSRKQGMQMAAEVVSKSFEQIDAQRCATTRSAIEEAMLSMYQGLPARDPKKDRVPPSFWDVYGTWKEETELFGGRTRDEVAKLPKEEGDELFQLALKAAVRRSTIEKLAMYLHNEAGQLSMLLCTAVMNFLGLSGEGKNVYFYGQPKVPLPTRPRSDLLRNPNGLSATWGYDNLTAYVRQVISNHEMCRIAAEKYGYSVEKILEMIQIDKGAIIGATNDAPREMRVSGGALTLAWCYYAAVIETVFRPIKEDYEALIKSKPGSWVCKLCDTINPDQGACGGCMCPKIVKS